MLHRSPLVLLVAALAAPLLPLPASAAAPAPHPALRGGATAPVPGYGYISFGTPDDLRPAGDLDRNGSQDLLEVHYLDDVRGEPTRALVAVRSGTTGRAAWSHELRLPSGHGVYAVTARLGRPARPGVVVVTYAFGEPGTPATRLTALDGRTGGALWTHLETGRVVGRQVTRPSLDGVLTGGAGADGLLLTRTATTPGEEAGSGSLRALRVDGADGRTTAFGPVVASAAGAPLAASGPDLDGDGVDDAAVVVPGAGGEVQVRSGVDGTPVWTAGPLPIGPSPVLDVAGPLSGATVHGLTVPDVALSTGRPAGPDGRTVEDVHGEVVLLAGDDGRTLLRRTGDRAVPLQRAGVPAVPALGVERTDAVRAPDGSTTATQTVTTLRPTGEQLYARERVARAPGDGSADPDDRPPYAYGQAAPVGDLDGDGAQDLVTRFQVFGSADLADHTSYLDGATGRDLPFGPGVRPLLGHLSSHGDDLEQTDVRGGGVLVQVLSGRTGRAVVRRRLAPGVPFEQADAAAAPVTGSRCDDVVVVADGPDDDLVTVLRNDGTVRWSLRGTRGGPALRQPQGGEPARGGCA